MPEATGETMRRLVAVIHRNYICVYISSSINKAARLLLSSRALGSSFGLPVVVARALGLVAVVARRHAQPLGAALVAERQARIQVLCVPASPRALRRALCKYQCKTIT
jgi:hypothetical protein